MRGMAAGQRGQLGEAEKPRALQAERCVMLPVGRQVMDSDIEDLAATLNQQVSDDPVQYSGFHSELFKAHTEGMSDGSRLGGAAEPEVVG